MKKLCFLLLTAMLILASCQVTTPGSLSGTIPDVTTGTIALHIQGNLDAKTLLPDLSMEIAYFQITAVGRRARSWI